MQAQARSVQQLGKQIELCIEHCQQCHRICLETITHCLEMGRQHAKTSHIRLLLDCAEICQTAANFMFRNSDLHSIICSSCAEVCLRCADECERFGDDERMKACAEACRRCAESCQLMVASTTATGKV